MKNSWNTWLDLLVTSGLKAEVSSLEHRAHEKLIRWLKLFFFSFSPTEASSPVDVEKKPFDRLKEDVSALVGGGKSKAAEKAKKKEKAAAKKLTKSKSTEQQPQATPTFGATVFHFPTYTLLHYVDFHWLEQSSLYFSFLFLSLVGRSNSSKRNPRARREIYWRGGFGNGRAVSSSG